MTTYKKLTVFKFLHKETFGNWRIRFERHIMLSSLVSFATLISVRRLLETLSTFRFFKSWSSGGYRLSLFALMSSDLNILFLFIHTWLLQSRAFQKYKIWLPTRQDLFYYLRLTNLNRSVGNSSSLQLAKVQTPVFDAFSRWIFVCLLPIYHFSRFQNFKFNRSQIH